MTEWELKRRNMRRYNLTAHLYESRYLMEQEQKIKAALENLELGRKCSILDMGCGTGLLFSYLRDSPYIAVGLDLSKGMLEKARRARKHCENIHLILADADYIPLRSSSFDKVFAITLLQNMPNGNRTLQEAKRVMTPNAKLVVTGLTSYFNQEAFSWLFNRTEFGTVLIVPSDKSRFHIAICEKKKPRSNCC